MQDLRKGVSKPASVDQYLAGLSTEKRAALERLRQDIRAAAPAAEECISYGIPGLRLDGQYLLGFGATGKHCAFYPGSIVQQYQRELGQYDTAKGTIRFQPNDPLPSALVRKLVKARIAQRRRPSGQAKL